MARKKKQSATADEHNAEAEEVRQEAREADSNVVDLMSAAERWQKKQELILSLADRLDDIFADAGLIKDRMKSVRLDAKANDIDWKALSQMATMRRLSEEKRNLRRRAAREIAQAFGWQDGEQLDMLDDRAEGLIPGQQREFMGVTEPEVSPDRQAALDSGFFTREELGLAEEVH